MENRETHTLRRFLAIMLSFALIITWMVPSVAVYADNSDPVTAAEEAGEAEIPESGAEDLQDSSSSEDEDVPAAEVYEEGNGGETDQQEQNADAEIVTKSPDRYCECRKRRSQGSTDSG